MAKNTKIPPCGARDVTPDAMQMRAGDRTAEHHRRDDAERVGRRERDRALGDEAERREATAALPFSRSGSLNSRGRTKVASAIASGGTMPAAITAAMISKRRRGRRGEAGGGERVGRLVDRAAEVEAHHQAEDDAEQNGGGPGHAAEPVGQAGRDRGQRAAEQHEHQQADERAMRTAG